MNSREAQVNAPARTAPEIARARILVVDDEPIILGLIEAMLCDRHEVLLAQGGEEARELLCNDQAFDLVFCDMTMPVLDGVALHEFVIENAPELAPRVYFLSGGIHTDRAREHLRRTGNRVVDKPFTIAQLDAVVEAAMASA